MYFIIFLYFIIIIIIYLNLTSNLMPNSIYYEYPPRGWDAYILAFNFGVLGSSPGIAQHKIFCDLLVVICSHGHESKIL